MYEVEDVETQKQLAIKLAFSRDDAASLEKEFEVLSALKGNEAIVRTEGFLYNPKLEAVREDGTVREKSR